MKYTTQALLGGIIGGTLYGWLGWFTIFLAVWIAGAVICFYLCEMDSGDKYAEWIMVLLCAIIAWPFLIPAAAFLDRPFFCKFFHLPYFEFRSPIIIKKTEES